MVKYLGQRRRYDFVSFPYPTKYSIWDPGESLSLKSPTAIKVHFDPIRRRYDKSWGSSFFLMI
jgi:hypothetical protein